MEIVERPPTRLDLPGAAEPVNIATQRWALERWEGEDPTELGAMWSSKGKFSVDGRRSCAELAVLHHVRSDGWQGFWVNAFGPGELRSEWFPDPAAKAITETGAPEWAAEIFEDLRAANDGRLGGFFDVFAWREPGEVRFLEVKVGGDSIGLNQRKFVKLALDLGHRLDEFTIIKVRGAVDRSGPLAERQKAQAGMTAQHVTERESLHAGVTLVWVAAWFTHDNGSENAVLGAFTTRESAKDACSRMVPQDFHEEWDDGELASVRWIPRDGFGHEGTWNVIACPLSEV